MADPVAMPPPPGSNDWLTGKAVGAAEGLIQAITPKLKSINEPAPVASPEYVKGLEARTKAMPASGVPAAKPKFDPNNPWANR